jgi:hypothetical protein
MADPTMPSNPAGRYPQPYCTSGKAVISGKKNHGPFGTIKFFCPNDRWWHVPGNL